MLSVLSIPVLLFAEKSGNSVALELLAALGWLVGISIALCIVGVAAYRYLYASVSSSSQQVPTFSLSDLRRLRDEGQITEAEYRRARSKVIGEGQDAIDTVDAEPPPDEYDDVSDPDAR